jgi:hypothetical protein
LAIIIPEELEQERAAPVPLTRRPTRVVDPATVRELKRSVDYLDARVEEEGELSGPVKQSTVRQLPDSVLDNIILRHGIGQARPEPEPEPAPRGDFLELPPESEFKVTRDPFRSPLKRRAEPVPITGEPVFQGEAEFDRTAAEAAELDKPLVRMARLERERRRPLTSFGEEFQKARAAGERTFEYDGSQFPTRQRGESETDWTTALGESAPLRLMAEMESEEATAEAPEEAPVTDFGEYLSKTGIPVKEGVTIEGVRPEMIEGSNKVTMALKAAGLGSTITSGMRTPEKGQKKSFHGVGLALDYRLKTADEAGLARLRTELDKLGKQTQTRAGNPMWTTDDGYQIIIHGVGDNIHVHIEYDTAQTKAEMHKAYGALV